MYTIENMRVLMTLSNAFTHDPRVYNEALSLVKNGHQVTILAWDRDKKNKKREVIDGINVVRFHNTKFMDIIPYDIFRLHFWWKNGYKLALKQHEKKNFDVIHCHDLDTLPIGVKLKKKLGLPLIYDAHEIWGYMVARDIPEWWAKRFLEKEKSLVKKVDHIITVNEPLKEYFIGITKSPITLVMNCKPLQKTEYVPTNNEYFTILYIGTLNESRFILGLSDAVKGLSDVKCIIGGKGKTEYVDILRDRCSKISNIKFIGVVPRDDVLTLTKKADLIICMTNPDDKNNSIALANKQFEAMVCGKPIISTKGTYPGKFTEREDVGQNAEFDQQDLRQKIIKLKDNPKLCEKLGKNALNTAIREYNWKKQEEKLVSVYEGMH